MRKLITAMFLCLIFLLLSGCKGKQADYIKIIDAYIDGFQACMSKGMNTQSLVCSFRPIMPIDGQLLPHPPCATV